MTRLRLGTELSPESIFRKEIFLLSGDSCCPDQDRLFFK